MANVMDVYKNLPQTNCQKCGEHSCMSFAMNVLKGANDLSDCTPLQGESFKESYEALKAMLSKMGEALETGHVMDYDKCNGCGNCVTVCPVTSVQDSGGGKDPDSDEVVYKVVDGKVKIINIERCRRTGEDKKCTLCKEACPLGVIDFV